MNYENKFLLTGTERQKEIVKHALDQIKFPWDRLTFPREPVEIGWTDLNSGTFAKTAKFHQSGTIGKINGREYILGVFYTHSGVIYIDNLLVQYPEIACSTVSAEIAHSVDYFLPLTDQQRKEITTLIHGGDDTDHGHSWWEKYDYSTEYFTLVGEAFMQAFTVAYSDMFFDSEGWAHALKIEDAPKLRAILGIERTDFVPDPSGTDTRPPKPSKPRGNPSMDKKLVSEQDHEAQYIASKYKIPINVVREVLKETQSRRKVYELLRAKGYVIGKK
jgi:hypothetical protein